MANILAAVRWWDEWQMRILISGSLLIQWFLLLTAPMRKYAIGKYSIGRVLEFLIWLAYVSSDALAIYALATLFNRQAKASSPCYVGYRASSIEVLWAPILLIHLGGRQEITAFDIKDNELWTRQTVTQVSQVTVALYAFYKTWPSSGDNRLLWSAILLFVVGILSACEKPWALSRASINRFKAVSSLAAGRRKKLTWWESLFTGDILSVFGKKMTPPPPPTTANGGTEVHLTEVDKIQMMLSDFSLLAAATDLESQGRSESAKSILEPLVAGAERNMRHWLHKAFGLIYTRANVISTPAYLACHAVLVPSLHVAAIVLFATSHKQAYRQFNATDVRMTYVVLCLTAVLDVFGLLISKLVYYILSRTPLPAVCETVAGLNLIDAAIDSKKRVRQVLSRLGCQAGCASDRDRDNMYIRVAGMVVLDLVSERSLADLDLASYRSTTRDHNWTLGRLDPLVFEGTFGEAADGQMAGSLRGLPFDVSVLHWHIATDLCFRSSTQTTGRVESLHRECAAGISNYMAHLLNSRPEMLMTGSRKHLFEEAMENTGDLLGEQQLPHDRSHVAKFIEDAIRSPQYPLLHNACMLAAELMDMEEATRWEVMYRVWTGMLCYSASMCRGYLHAKSLGEGGEFLSFVWLVIALKGGKTQADKHQMPDHAG